jgi:L-asparaginase/Glu-tRNA(Gln) amidotransferase subunit D
MSTDPSKTGELYSSATIGVEQLIVDAQFDETNIEIQYEQFLQKISHEITNEEILLLAHRINTVIKKNTV